MPARRPLALNAPIVVKMPQRGPLMLVYLTNVRGERVVIIQVNWIGSSWSPGLSPHVQGRC